MAVFALAAKAAIRLPPNSLRSEAYDLLDHPAIESLRVSEWTFSQDSISLFGRVQARL